MKQKLVPGRKIICLNRKASFNYFFLELLEAGIVLKGSEVKSLRDGKGSIADSYAVDNNGEMFLVNSHIPLYRQSSYNNHDPKGDRKLLFKKKEINKLIGRINQDGLTLIPTKLYFSKGNDLGHSIHSTKINVSHKFCKVPTIKFSQWLIDNILLGSGVTAYCV